MKKTIKIIGLTLCLMLAFNKSYGQGWAKIFNYYSLASYGENLEDDFFPLKDGGVITSDFGYDYSTGTANNFSIYLNRFDKYGNIIWDRKPFYTYTPFCEFDSVTQTFSNCNYDTFSVTGPCQLIQLPNNNIIIEHVAVAYFDPYSKSAPKYFTVVDNYGNLIKRVHNNNDSILLGYSNPNGLGNYEKMFYNEDNNTIECINFYTTGKDSVLFIKSVYDTNLVKLSTSQKLTVKQNLTNSQTSSLAAYGLSFFKSKKGNYYWYDNYENYNSPGNFTPSRIIKFNSSGNLMYDTSISEITLKNTLLPTLPNGYNNFGLNSSNSEIDIAENNRNETTLGIWVRCSFDTLDASGYKTVFKTKYVLYTLDSLGSIKYSNVIESMYDSISRFFYDIRTHTLFVKNISDDTLLVIAVNDGHDNQSYPNGFPWEVIKINIKTNQIFLQKFNYLTGYNNLYQYAKSRQQIKRYTKDEKYMFVNFLYSTENNSSRNYGIAKIDNNGFSFGNVLVGNAYNDANNNCIKNNTEKGIKNYTVTATKNNFNNYGTTDKNGDYFIGLADSGNYTVTVRPNPMYPLWNSVCSPSQNIIVENDIAYDTANFALKPTILCPFNTVNVSSTPPFRVGRPQTYYVSYCNNGTVASPNTYITLKLDSLLDINSASISYTSLLNHTYRFNIGNLDFLTCGNFTFVATPRIGAVQLNQTLCVETHIYPDTICSTPAYNGAFIEASAQCLGDSVRFQLQNTGNGNMTVPKRYIVIEGNVMRINQSYQLNQDQILTETLKANSGQTYRIIAEQPDDLPASYGDRFATAAVENCQPISSNFQTGFLTQFPNYDGEPYRALSCNVITGAYDPNDKVAMPVGYAAQHYIEANTQIDYQINFQNTGNDTAFKVIIVDTIAATLDINSIQPGVASHNYQFQRIDSNVVQFVFDSIKLVDSFRNERLSHGFIKFKIQQKLNNSNGTKIYNKANIYFDFNAAITTNQTYHTVGRDFIQVNLISGIKNTKYNVKEVKVYPNPFREKTQISIESDVLKNPVLLLMNMKGQVLKTISSSSQNTFDLYREDLSNGIYIFKILQNNEQVASGKLMVQ